MLESFSASGFLVHTPCGPRKSGMPESVEMPAPVRTVTRSASSMRVRACSISEIMKYSESHQKVAAVRSSLGGPMKTSPVFPADSLTIRPWPDAVIDTVGIDPRSSYVETFWLGVLGPSTTWLLRRLVNGLEASPAGYDLDLTDTARQLGLGDKGGRHSPFVRALTRC